jgi:hypothetical protein
MYILFISKQQTTLHCEFLFHAESVRRQLIFYDYVYAFLGYQLTRFYVKS